MPTGDGWAFMSSGIVLLQLGQYMLPQRPTGWASTNVWLESRFSSRIQLRLASEDLGVVDMVSRLAWMVAADCGRVSMSCCIASGDMFSGCSGAKYEGC
jgi:hypothetical protein